MTSFLFSAAATPRHTRPGRAMRGPAAVPPMAPLPQAAGTKKIPMASGHGDFLYPYQSDKYAFQYILQIVLALSAPGSQSARHVARQLM